MALFPDYNQIYGTAVSVSSGIEIDHSMGGKIRSRIMYESSTYMINVVFGILTPDQADSLDTFYDLYKASENTLNLAHDGKTYNVIFASDFQREKVGVDSYNVSVQLQGKRL